VITIGYSILAASGQLRVTHELFPFGAEIDFDLRHPLDHAAQEELRQLRLKYHLLLFRNQQLSLQQQERVMRSLGPILDDDNDRMDFISSDDSIGIFGTGKISFHSDLAFTQHPFPAISLLAVDVVDGDTSTTFASNVLAYKALPAALKAQLRGMQALHCMAMNNETRTHDLDIPPNFPRTVHQLVMPHPINGEPILFALFQQTACILGLPAETSEAMLSALFIHLYAPENIYEHRWCKGDFVIWDNMALQHARLETVNSVRTLQRVTCGEFGLRTLYPAVKDIFGESVAGYVAQNAAAKAQR
jgi:taurine dioxygenase